MITPYRLEELMEILINSDDISWDLGLMTDEERQAVRAEALEMMQDRHLDDAEIVFYGEIIFETDDEVTQEKTERIL
jgi:hypothetical protein